MIEEIWAIDPGTTQSALVVLSGDTPIVRQIMPNAELESFLWFQAPEMDACCVIEMVASYGMPVGRDVFETVRWIGRFGAAWDLKQTEKSELLFRYDAKVHLCGTPRAKDANIRQALIDRYGPGKEAAIGLKKSPGPLYGFKSHMWAALAVGVTYADQNKDVNDAPRPEQDTSRAKDHAREKEGSAS